MVIMNISIKKNVYDCISKPVAKALVGRTLLGFLGVVLSTNSVKELPLVLVSMSNNTVPLITAVLGYFMLKEKLGTFDIGCLAASFTGVTIIVVGHSIYGKDASNHD
jgi:drug/metabolite transporter (DMT)-like permease